MSNLPKRGEIDLGECQAMEVWKWSFQDEVGYTCTQMLVGTEMKIHSEAIVTIWGEAEKVEFFKKHVPEMRYICEVEKDPSPFLTLGEESSYQLWTTKAGMEYLLTHKLDKLLGYNFTDEQMGIFENEPT